MANELLLNFSLLYDDGVADPFTFVVDSLYRTIATLRPITYVQTVGLTDTAIDIGVGGTKGYFCIKNIDPTNFVQLKTASAGTIVAKLFPGDFTVIALGSGMQAPYAIADTASCLCQVALIMR